jgi:stage V sporulation protein B
VGGSVFGMSRAVSQAPPGEVDAVIRRGLVVHLVLAVILGVGFWCGSSLLGALLNSEYLVPYFRWLSVVVAAYTIYAAFVGVLNGQRRFVAQAALDVIAATLRTIALIAGAYLAARVGVVDAGAAGSVGGALIGFALMSVAMVAIAGVFVGTGRRGATLHSYGRQLHFVLPVMGAQFLLNLLLQADTNTLRAAATRAAEDAGLEVNRADVLVGAYNAGQLYAFLPYQLLTALTFLLFPLLATAHGSGETQRVRTVVAHGCRITLVVVGLLVSSTAALPAPLLRLVFPPSLALFGVFSAVLNGVGKQWVSLVLTACGAAGVLGVNLWLTHGASFGPSLLVRTATATSVAVTLTCVAAGVAVWRSTGAGVRGLGIARVAIAVGCCVYLGSWVGAPSRFMTVVFAAGLGVVYILILVLLRELKAEDWAQLRLLRQPRGQ